MELHNSLKHLSALLRPSWGYLTMTDLVRAARGVLPEPIITVQVSPWGNKVCCVRVCVCENVWQYVLCAFEAYVCDDIIGYMAVWLYVRMVIATPAPYDMTHNLNTF
jgi:hypothetical protein